jgi:hypothetical protein
MGLQCYCLEQTSALQLSSIPSETTPATLIATSYQTNVPLDSQPIMKVPISAIFGGVMGGLLIVIACAIVFFCLRKRRRHRRVQLPLLAQSPVPKPQPSMNIEQIGDTSTAAQEPLPKHHDGHDGSGNHIGPVPPRTKSSHDERIQDQSHVPPLADIEVMAAGSSRQDGDRNALGVQNR